MIDEAPIPPHLIGLSETTGKPPESRLTCGFQARQMVGQAINEDQGRSRQRAIVDGLINGNPPYNDQQRKANGLSWTCNLNFMEGDALMDSSAIPYYQLFNGVQNYCEVKSKLRDPDATRWSDAISHRFSNMLKRWDRFDWEMQSISYHMRLHGIGPYLFDRQDDWRFRSVPTGMVLAPRGTPSRIDSRTKWLAARMSYTVVELYGFISGGAAESAGWNVEAVKNAIKMAAKGLNNGQNGLSVNWRDNAWELYEQRLKNNDLANAYRDFDDVWVDHLFVQEFPKAGKRQGKISHFIITETPVYANGEKAEDDKDFLMRRPNEFDDYSQCIGVFFQNAGNMTWHGVRGLADKAFKHLEISNRLKCRMVDGAFIESSLVLQSDSEKSKEKLALTQVGPVTIVPAGLKIQQTKLSGFLDGPMTVDRLVGNNLANNIGMFQGRAIAREDGRGEVPTATQVQAQVARESSLSQGQMTLYYLDLDQLYTEMFRRACESGDEEAKLFREECLDDGVPEEALKFKNIEFIRANRASGYGSPQMRQMTDQQLMPFASMLPTQGLQNFLDDAIAGIKGADKVERYNPRDYVPTQDDSIAANENGTMRSGASPVISTGQNDEVHLHSHLEDAATLLAPVQEEMEQTGGNPESMVEAFKYIQILAPHCEQHLARLSQSPFRKQAAKLFRDTLQNLVGFNSKLRGAIVRAQRQAQQAAQEQQQATALGALDQAKLQQVQAQTQMAAMKTQSHIENQQAKTTANINTKAAETISNLRSKQIEATTNAAVKLRTSKTE